VFSTRASKKSVKFSLFPCWLSFCEQIIHT